VIALDGPIYLDMPLLWRGEHLLRVVFRRGGRIGHQGDLVLRPAQSARDVNLVDVYWVMRLTLVVCRTLASRGKSATPASKVLIEESKSARDSRKEDTHPSNECAILED